MIARHQRHAGLLHQHLGAGFGTHRPDHVGGRADEYQSRLEAGLREFGALGKKAVAGMHGLRTALASGFDHARDVEIAVARPCRPEQDGLVGHGDMHGVAVSLGIDRHRAQPHRLCGADHTTGDLATIGYQQAAKSPEMWGAIHHPTGNRPKGVGWTGAWAAAETPSPNTSLVSAGSI